MENGIRGNGQEKRKIISVPATETFFPFPDRFSVFPMKTVYGRVKRNTEPVGTGFSRPVFTPTLKRSMGRALSGLEPAKEKDSMRSTSQPK